MYFDIIYQLVKRCFPPHFDWFFPASQNSTDLRAIENRLFDVMVLETEAVSDGDEQVLMTLIKLVPLRLFLFL